MTTPDPSTTISLTDNVLFLIAVGLLGAAIPFVLFNMRCAKEVTKCRNYELSKVKIDRLNSENSLKDCVIKIIKINRKYDYRHANINYAYWSYIGMILASGYGFLCEYFELDGNYAQPALPALVLAGIIFSVNMVAVTWRAITHSSGVVEQDNTSQQRLNGDQ
jgi:hypothetical protein